MKNYFKFVNRHYTKLIVTWMIITSLTVEWAMGINSMFGLIYITVGMLIVIPFLFISNYREKPKVTDESHL